MGFGSRLAPLCTDLYSRELLQSANIVPMSPALDLRSVVERSVGVYGTAPTCYLSALARVPDLTLAEFDVYGVTGAQRKLCAKGLDTLMRLGGRPDMPAAG